MTFEGFSAQIADMSLCQWDAVIGASLAAAVWDLRTGRIPNVLTLTFAGVGVVYASCRAGLGGVGEAFLAWTIMALPYIILFLLGRGGAGDAKMMGAVGAWLGIQPGVMTLCCVALVGGVLAVVKVVAHAERRRMIRNLLASAYVFTVTLASGREGWRLLRNDSPESRQLTDRDVTLPYGAAIFLGVCLSAATAHFWIR